MTDERDFENALKKQFRLGSCEVNYLREEGIIEGAKFGRDFERDRVKLTLEAEKLIDYLRRIADSELADCRTVSHDALLEAASYIERIAGKV